MKDQQEDQCPSMTAVEQFERDRKAFAIVAKETGIFDVLAKFALTFGRIPSASITTSNGVTTAYTTPPNIMMSQINGASHSPTNKPPTSKIPTSKIPTNESPISNNYSRTKAHYRSR